MKTVTLERKLVALAGTLLDQAGALVVASGGLPPDYVADETLDAALARDPALKDARRCAQNALRAFRDSGGGNDASRRFHALEEAVNAHGAKCAELGYRVGFRVGQAVKGAR